ncbi:hypothetical protein LZ554_003062 [Drepanopeziza brunnea f. sp. 'monogermtubi']|nr:hypothetical protein LZ554_003062 [Drepanopeziza brunnea f. sp. 'monogermtubi']
MLTFARLPYWRSSGLESLHSVRPETTITGLYLRGSTTALKRPVIKLNSNYFTSGENLCHTARVLSAVDTRFSRMLGALGALGLS